MHACGSATYLDIIFLVAAALVCVAAAGQIAATRDEEAGDTSIIWLRGESAGCYWLAGRLLADVTLIIVASLAAGLADEAGGHAELSFVQLRRPA